MEDGVPYVSEGRAYHAGDVVILRLRRQMDGDTVLRLRAMLKDRSDVTGVHFLILDPDVEVVEPSS